MTGMEDWPNIIQNFHKHNAADDGGGGGHDNGNLYVETDITIVTKCKFVCLPLHFNIYPVEKLNENSRFFFYYIINSLMWPRVIKQHHYWYLGWPI